MKGIILSEFIEFLEVEHGNDIAQMIIDDSGVKSGGAYARVGLYDYHELIQLLTQTVAHTKVAEKKLLHDFSEHLFSVFRRDYSAFFGEANTAVEMLMQIDNHIHVEVQKLYPDAELPSFSHSVEGEFLLLSYSSPRPLAGVAEALALACIKYFGNEEKLISSEFLDDNRKANFVIQIKAA